MKITVPSHLPAAPHRRATNSARPFGRMLIHEPQVMLQRLRKAPQIGHGFTAGNHFSMARSMPFEVP